MEKTSKIKSSKFLKEWQGDKGIIYYHEIELDNGDHGQIGTKERLPDKLNMGQELTYTIESGSYGNKIKAVNPGGGSGFKGGRQQQEPKIQFIGFAARYSIDYLIANKEPLNQFDKAFDVIYNKMISKI